MYDWLWNIINMEVYGFYPYRFITLIIVACVYTFIAAIVGVISKKYNPNMFANGEPALAYGMFWPLILILGVLFSPVIVGAMVYAQLEHKYITEKKSLE
jgi:uncharacterized membrane protein